ncbi:MAG: hypothetical protein PHX83_00070 [Acidobacteriia bacterium]|nr:hypothetical protein [Terriglobia bacterium]
MKARYYIVGLLLTILALPIAAQDLGEVARKERARQAAIQQKSKVYTNSDIATTRPAESVVTPKEAAPTAGAILDREGHDERYWSEKFLAAKQKLSDALATKTRLEQEIKDYSYRLLNQTDVYDREHLYGPLIYEHQQALDKNKKDIAAAQAELDDLYVQLRQAGAPASWADSRLAEQPPAPEQPTREYYAELLKHLDAKYDAMARPYLEERFRLINRRAPAAGEPLAIDTGKLGLGIDPSIPQLDAQIKEVEDAHQKAREELLLQARRAGFNLQ